MRTLVLLCCCLGSLLVGCQSIGPSRVAGDRFGYSHALADSWKKQMLLNIVKTRYLDLPIFLDVGQVVSGYSLETSVSITGGLSSGPLSPNSGTLGGAGRFTDRPTITYIPMTGERFLEGFLTPIKPANVFALLQAGYAADFILELCLDSLNGLHNRPASLASNRQPDPSFFTVLGLIREVQDAGAVGMRISVGDNGQATSVLFFRRENISAEIREKSAEIRRLIGVDLEASEFELVYSPMRGGPGELGVGTRSMWQIMGAMAMGISIPESHLEKHLVPPLSGIAENEIALMRIRSGEEEPSEAFVAVAYEGQWFWIANDDWRSKRTFTSTLFLFTLTDAVASERLPTITIPAQ